MPKPPPMVVEQVGEKWRVRRTDYTNPQHAILCRPMAKSEAERYKALLEGTVDDPDFVMVAALDPAQLERERQVRREWIARERAAGRQLPPKVPPKQMTKKQYLARAKEMEMPHQMDDTIFKQLKQVRDTSEVNMVDRQGVMVVANRLQCYHLVTHLADFEGRGGRTSAEGSQAYMALLGRFSIWLEQQEGRTDGRIRVTPQ